MKTYLNPEVRLLDSTSNQNLGYRLWLKSRDAIISHTDDESLDIDLVKDVLPKKFKVGDEVVDNNDYLTRINNMNLQYNNFDYFVFEIQGSCLFRDVLFNINKLAMWAQSNRFLFSILDKDAVYQDQNYPISSEYKDIPEWEDQFDKYMEAIKNDPIVDHNRLEMPYSITSKFWIGINLKTLIDVISFLRLKLPFFYEVYGKQFESILATKGIIISKDSTYSSMIKQYIFDNDYTHKEEVIKVKDNVIVTTQMGLILYSQFIRQADTRITGLYNILFHDDISEFSHKVFKGSTVFNIEYIAHKDKVKSTISTRLCAFAMSSGDDPCSWNHFIKHLLPSGFNQDDLEELLPCKFKCGKLTNCKFHDDVKFRNEGKEISNCPCPLVTLKMTDAVRKRERDHNVIGDAFYHLTAKYAGLDFAYTTNIGNRWTSRLILRSDKQLSDSMVNVIEYELTTLEKAYSQFINVKDRRNPLTFEIPEKYYRYGLSKVDENGDEYVDLTCMMKGYAIDHMITNLICNRFDRFMIDFGGDIYIHNASGVVAIDGTDFLVQVNGRTSIFTSGNTSKRGDHIPGGHRGITTVIKPWLPSENVENLLVDILATKSHANENTDIILPNSTVIKFNEDGNCMNRVYCASPFFDDKQIEIRDNMISKFTNVFRPDKTDSSVEYDSRETITKELLNKVVEDNKFGIFSSDILVYPRHTTDLGTLFEVGYSIEIHPSVIKFDESKKKYIICSVIYPLVDDSFYTRETYCKSKDRNILIDCTNKAQVMGMGSLARGLDTGYLNKDQFKIFYELHGSKDNIMLSNEYTQVKKVNKKYYTVERDLNEKDK